MRPLVFSPYFHGGGSSLATRIAHVAYRPLGRLLFRACDHIVCLSTAEADAVGESYPRLRAPVSVIPPGISTDINVEPFNTRANVLLTAGRLESYKQFDRVVLAAEHLPSGYEIVVAGDGTRRNELMEIIRRRNLTDRVRMLGRLPEDELRRWFVTGSVLVSMSSHESFGLTLMEALAAGTPVVASDIPPHREISVAQPAAAVRLVALEAPPEQLAAAIISATHQGLPRNVRVPTWDESASQVLDIYRSLVSSGELKARGQANRF